MNKKIILIFSIIILFILCILFLVNSPKTDQKGTITIELIDFKNSDGTLFVGLYNNAKGFPKTTESMIKNISVKIENKKAVVEFKDVPYGIYAISGFQDENSNSILDTGSFEVPKEAFFFSNNAMGSSGPPAFKDAKFELKSDNMKLKVKAQFI